jgi:mono/diheme cytochrome c family protein
VAVPARTWIALLGFVALTLGAGMAWDAGLFLPPPPPLVETPEAVAAGRAVFASRCARCHRDVPLDRRVAGWTAERAYLTIGRLPGVPRAGMPPFAGSEEERRALALFLAALGAGRARQP